MTTYNQFICGNDGDALEIRNDALSGTYQPAEWLINWATGGRNDSGVAVNGYSALTHCPLWQGVNIIAGDFGQTPVRLLRNEFSEQRKHPSWNLLRVSPNELQTPSVWKETMMQWAIVWGNGVSWIRRQGSRPVELIPLRPDCLWHQVMAFEDQKVLLYHYHSPYPVGTGGTTYTFFPWEVVHLQGLTGDGVWGYPLWQVARNTIGFGLALEKHGNRQFSNGARPSGVLEHPQKLSPDAIKNLRSEWNHVHQGPDNAGKIAILWEGMKFNATSLSNIDAQWLEAKKMSVLEAASLLNLPPHKLGAMEDTANRATLEEQNADYVSRTLNRWYTRADEEYRKKLLTDQEWKSDEFQFQHQADAFLKGDIDTLTTVADRCVKATLMNPNEGRRMIGLPPYSGGEKYGSPAINPAGADPNENSPSSAGKTPKAPPKGPQNAITLTDEQKQAWLIGNIVSRVNHTVHRESEALQSAARTKKNFIAWMDSFYGTETHRGRLAELLDENISDLACEAGELRKIRSRVKAWGLKRREILMDMCGTITGGELNDAVERFTHSGDQSAWTAWIQNNDWSLGNGPENI